MEHQEFRPRIHHGPQETRQQQQQQGIDLVSTTYVRTYVREGSLLKLQIDDHKTIISLKNSDQSLAILLRAHYNL
jgi:hypothetical protein